eukprot:Phypoly_transcript_19746.p1 GENE.Phypoly_transcript_19746~~Phypoly_transcript_19746.p1  ORF type:complete len:139 (+),score=12.86 Phypoly_transcript_19746:136-552(+)
MERVFLPLWRLFVLQVLPNPIFTYLTLPLLSSSSKVSLISYIISSKKTNIIYFPEVGRKRGSLQEEMREGKEGLLTNLLMITSFADDGSDSDTLSFVWPSLLCHLLKTTHEPLSHLFWNFAKSTNSTLNHSGLGFQQN